MKVLKSLFGKVDGYKTYIVATAGFVLWLGVVLEWWTMAQVDELFGLLAVMGVYTINHAIKKTK